MAQYFKNEEGHDVGLCPTCKKIKPRSYLRPETHPRTGFRNCIECSREQNRLVQQQGDLMRQIIFERAGGCVWSGCHMKYPRDFRGNFALDHIDPELKLHNYETASQWIACNQEEFWSRIVPNLQVLCVHHNLIKMAEEYRVGGRMHVNPWDKDEEEIPHIDFNEIKLVLPGFEEYANPLT